MLKKKKKCMGRLLREWSSGGVGEGVGKDEPEEHFGSMSERVEKKKRISIFKAQSPHRECFLSLKGVFDVA